MRTNGIHLVVATVLTGIVGLTLLQIIKHLYAANNPAFEIEHLFGNSQIMAAGLAVTGLLILYSAFGNTRKGTTGGPLTVRSAGVVGAVQGICLPFRGLSRSGATISTGLALGVARVRAEAFSFALAVVLTPAVIVKEGYRFLKTSLTGGAGASLVHLLVPSVLGMVMSFVSGLLALRWLSSWLAHDRWYLFGIYCLFASMVVFFVG